MKQAYHCKIQKLEAFYHFLFIPCVVGNINLEIATELTNQLKTDTLGQQVAKVPGMVQLKKHKALKKVNDLNPISEYSKTVAQCRIN